MNLEVLASILLEALKRQAANHMGIGEREAKELIFKNPLPLLPPLHLFLLFYFFLSF